MLDIRLWPLNTLLWSAGSLFFVKTYISFLTFLSTCFSAFSLSLYKSKGRNVGRQTKKSRLSMSSSIELHSFCFRCNVTFFYQVILWYLQHCLSVYFCRLRFILLFHRENVNSRNIAWIFREYNVQRDSFKCPRRWLVFILLKEFLF